MLSINSINYKRNFRLTDRNFSFLGGRPAATVGGIQTLLFKTADVGLAPNEADSISSFDGGGRVH
jgi:hypothetical protein